MHVTRDVIRDLLPLYAAGEASADTVTLVEAYLQDDEELVRDLRALSAAEAPVGDVSPAPGADRLALHRAKTWLRLRTWLFAGAILCSSLPFTVVYRKGAVAFFMPRDAPQTAAVFLVCAALLWAGFVVVSRRLRVTGL